MVDDAKITATDVLSQMGINGEPELYILGCLEPRITLYSQQIRALNLIYALVETRKLLKDDSALIVGAGVAGLTAAAAASMVGCRVTVVEKASTTMHLQRGSSLRWLHPRIYDWPREGSENPDAGLPLLNWNAGTAGEVVRKIDGLFEDIKAANGIRVLRNVRDIKIDALNRGVRNASWNAPGFEINSFKTVILAVGFGVEKTFAHLPLHSYWHDDALHQERAEPRRVLISGTGDGGMVDLLRAKLFDFRHDEFVQEISKAADLSQVKASLLEIEEAYARDSDELAMYHAYQNLTVPVELDDYLRLRIRPNVNVTLHGNGRSPLNGNTSILHRFVVSRLLKLGVNYVDGDITVSPLTGNKQEITFSNGKRDSFDEVVIRHGANSALKESFPKYWEMANSNRLSAHLDQTRRPIWPTGFWEKMASQIPKIPPPVTLNRADISPTRPSFNLPFPSKGAGLIGRSEPLEFARVQLLNGPRTALGHAAAFQGLGGLGKTQLAVEYAWKYGASYANGVIWIFADQDIDAQLTLLAGQAGWIAEQSEHQIKLAIAKNRLRTFPETLLIFDAVESVDVIKSYLPPPTVGSHVLITSRQSHPGFNAIPLQLMEVAEATALLYSEAGRTPIDPEEQIAGQQIVRRLDGLPLAIEIAGAFLRDLASMSFREYQALLEKDPVRSLRGEGFSSFTGHEADLDSTLKISESLFAKEPLLKRLIDLLTWSGPSAMGKSLMTALLGVEEWELSAPLARGVTLRLIYIENEAAATRDLVGYRLHRLVQDVRRRHSDLGIQREWVSAICNRLGDWFEARREDVLRLPEYEYEFDHLRTWANWAADFAPNQSAKLVWLQAYPPYHRGTYSGALDLVEKAFLLNSGPTADEVLQSRLLLDHSFLLGSVGRYQDALRDSEASLALREKLFGSEHFENGIALNNLGAMSGVLGDVAKQRKSFERALEICQKTLGPKHTDTARALGQLGGALHYVGDYEGALALKVKSLNAYRDIVGNSHPDTARAMKAVALEYDELGQPALALEMRAQAEEVFRTTLGALHPDTLRTMGTSAIALIRSGSITDGLAKAERAFEMMGTAMGEDHPEIANALSILASAYGANGEYERATTFLLRALELCRSTFGNAHRETALIESNLGSNYLYLGKGVVAATHLTTALKTFRDLLGNSHPENANILRNLGSAYEQIGNRRIALKCLDEALDISVRAFGENHPSTASTLLSRASVRSSFRQYDQALDDQLMALRIKRERLGDAHLDTAWAHDSVGVTYIYLAKLPEAKLHIEEAFQIRREILGDDHPLTATSMNNVGGVHRKSGNKKLAAEWFHKALAIRRLKFGFAHPNTVITLVNLVETLADLGQPVEAFGLISTGLKHSVSKSIEAKKLRDARNKLVKRFPSLGGVATGHMPKKPRNRRR